MLSDGKFYNVEDFRVEENYILFFVRIFGGSSYREALIFNWVNGGEGEMVIR